MRLSASGEWTSLEDNTALVTASAVLAAVASQQFARFKLSQGLASWRRASVYSIDAWLSSCWQEAKYSSIDVAALLSPSQEHLLWESVIAESDQNLFDVSLTAHLVRDASRLTAEWQLSFEDDSWLDQEDTQKFRSWHDVFRRKCQNRGWMTRSDIWQAAPRWIEKRWCGQDPVVFAGFHQITPALRLLLRCIPGARLLDLDASAEKPRERARVVSCVDFKEELDTAARSARELLENGERSIAVFVPDLTANRRVVERVFRNVFYPASALRFVAERSVVFEPGASAFHCNRRPDLQNHPLIASAVLLLELARPRIQHSSAAAILRSPFLKDAHPEQHVRSLADLNLRRLRELDVSIRDMEYASRDCPRLSPVWHRVKDVLAANPQRAELSAWSKFFGDLVQAAGWPGDTELTASEQETVEAWNDTLSALSSLGMVSSQVGFDTALGHLQRSLSDTRETGDWYSPVQILDSSEAPGIYFDNAFVTGLSEQMWPPPLRRSPLIPAKLARDHGLPNSTPALRQEQKAWLTRALLRSGDEVVGTYTGRLSPLAQPHVEPSRDEYPLWAGRTPLQSFAPAALDEIADRSAPAFDVTKDVRGGTSIIKLQSLCPFRAFAEIRLRAQTPEEACFGFDSRDRGGFLHKALQYVWEELKTSAALRGVSAERLGNLVGEAVRRAVRDGGDSLFHSQTSSVERERLQDLILEWLTCVEKERQQSFTVEKVEDDIVYSLAGLPLRLRVDRIDRLPNGKLLLIDYKSGDQTKNKLDCPRPVEPQLLVYAVAKGGGVDGLLFGQVKARAVRLVGKTRGKHFKGSSIAVLNDKWDDVLTEAEAEVSKLADAFLAGDAVVDPAKQACDFCSNGPLCRVNEKSSQAEEGD